MDLLLYSPAGLSPCLQALCNFIFRVHLW